MSQEYIDVIAAHLRGEKIEYRVTHAVKYPEWSLTRNPDWDFFHCEYRIAPPVPKVPDQIDWNHVDLGFNFIARNMNGRTFLFFTKPYLGDLAWNGHGERIDHILTSYKRGTVEWTESLVERPKP